MADVGTQLEEWAAATEGASLEDGLNSDQVTSFLSSIGPIKDDAFSRETMAAVMKGAKVTDAAQVADIVGQFMEALKAPADNAAAAAAAPAPAAADAESKGGSGESKGTDSSGPPTKKKQGEKSPADILREAHEESAKYSAKLKGWNAQSHIKNKPKRTGWTKKREGYNPCLWGSDLFDWVAIICCFVILYGCTTGFYIGMFNFYLATDVDQEAMWFNVILLGCAAIVLFTVVRAGQKDRELKEAADAAAKRDMAVSAMEKAQQA